MNIIELIEPVWCEYDIFVYAALISSLATMVRSKEEIKWHQQFIVSFFGAIITGIIVKNFTDFNKELIFTAACAGGYFSLDLLRELKEVSQHLGDFMLKLIKRYLRIK